MTLLVVGIVIGIALSWIVRHLDARLAEREGEGPLARLWGRICAPYYRTRRRYRRWQERAITWWVHRPAIVTLLARRRWRVAYISVNFYGNDPDMGGAVPHVAAYSWHWTERGANWHRRHRPNYMGTMSFRCVTLIEHDTHEALDPSDISWWNAHSDEA